MWAVNLVLYALHVGGSSRVGESWQSPESWVQLGGFVLLLAGTIVYAQVRQPACRAGCSVLALRGDPVQRTRLASTRAFACVATVRAFAQEEDTHSSHK